MLDCFKGWGEMFNPMECFSVARQSQPAVGVYLHYLRPILLHCCTFFDVEVRFYRGHAARNAFRHHFCFLLLLILRVETRQLDRGVAAAS